MSSLAPLKTMCNGIKFPVIGLGTFPAVGSEAYDAVKYALKIGYRHVDTAYLYNNEPQVGGAVLDAMKEYEIDRKDIRVVTKLMNTCNRPSLVVPALQKSLTNLNLPFVDLFLIHTPVCRTPLVDDQVGPDGRKDESGKLLFDNIKPKEIWKEMEKCVKLGLTKSIGVSNFNSKQIHHIVDHCKIKPITNQVESHPYLQQDRLREFCAAFDIALTSYTPLGGILKSDDPDILNDELVKELAVKYNRTPAQILLRWHIEKDHIVLVKSSKPKRIKENFKIFDFSLSEGDVNKLRSLETGHRFWSYADSTSSPQYPFHLQF